MKKLLSLLLLFVLSVSAFATTRTGYYSTGQTREHVLNNVKIFEQQMMESKYFNVPVKKDSPHDYVQTWSHESQGAIAKATLHYQFFDDKVLVTMYDAVFISAKGNKIPLAENDPIDAKRNLYESLDNMLVTVFFKYLQVSETKSGVSNSVSTGSDYDMVTLNYLTGDTKETAKKFSKDFVNLVLKEAYVVNYLSSENADNQEIKYTLEDETGLVTVIMDYQFREKDFTIKIKSINYFHKVLKSDTKITKNSSTEATSKFYNIVKDYFLNQHSNYIAPKTK